MKVKSDAPSAALLGKVLGEKIFTAVFILLCDHIKVESPSFLGHNLIF